MAQSNTFALGDKAGICGSHLSIDTVDTAQVGGRRALTLIMQTEICGKIDDTSANRWRALGMTLHASSIYTRAPSSTAYTATEAASASLYLDANNNVIAVTKSGKTVKIGHASDPRHAYPITANPDMSFDLIIKDRPYRLGDSKQTPDSDKHIFVTGEGFD